MIIKWKCCLGGAWIIYFLCLVWGDCCDTASSWAVWHLNWKRESASDWSATSLHERQLTQMTRRRTAIAGCYSLSLSLSLSLCHSSTTDTKLIHIHLCLLHIKEVKICICCHGSQVGVLPASSEAIRDLESGGFRGVDREGDQSGTKDRISLDCLPVLLLLLKRKLCVIVT